MGESRQQDVTRILDELRRGEHGADERLLGLVYDELHRLAAAKMRGERADHTLQPTALVHEAWLKLSNGADVRWEGRGHFFGAAAEVMRRILVDHARAQRAFKRGGGRGEVPLETAVANASEHPDQLLAIDAALSAFEALDPEKAEVVRLRFFAGISLEEIAALQGVSVPTVKRRWSYARAWLYRKVGEV